jgi:hypothetical protein
VRASARRQSLTQLLLGQATDLTAYPIDALNSTPFIVDDLSSAFGYVPARHQAPRRPLSRTDRWNLYIARPRTSHQPHWLNQRIRQTGMLRRFKIPYKRSTTPLDHADIVALRGDSLTTPDSITQFCGTQVSPNTAEVYGFRLQDSIAKNPRLKLSFTLAGLFRE